MLYIIVPQLGERGYPLTILNMPSISKKDSMGFESMSFNKDSLIGVHKIRTCADAILQPVTPCCCIRLVDFLNTAQVVSFRYLCIFPVKHNKHYLLSTFQITLAQDFRTARRAYVLIQPVGVAATHISFNRYPVFLQDGVQIPRYLLLWLLIHKNIFNHYKTEGQRNRTSIAPLLGDALP